MTVFIQNEDPAKDIVVSVFDQHAPSDTVAIPTQRIAPGERGVYTNVVEDGNGRCWLDILVKDAHDVSKTKFFDGQRHRNYGVIFVDLLG